MESITHHFADDQDLLATYVLRRLDPGTLARLDEHARTCDTCREAVRKEKMIAGGVKRYGRDQLKARIRMQAANASSRQIPWPHIVSIAAVLVIVIGVGIYQRWFVTYVEQENAVLLAPPEKETSVGADIAEGAGEPAPVPPAAPRSAEPSLRQRDKEVDRPQSEVDAEMRRPREGSFEEPRTQERDVSGERKVSGYAPGAADRLEESAAAVGKDKGRTDASEPALEVAVPAQEFWTDGTVITGVSAKKEADERRAMKSIMKEEVQAVGRAQGETDAFGKVTLDQRPASKLPTTRQSQQLYDRRTIQTLVRQSEGETRLTLYPDSPFDTTQLHYARVQQVAPDSIIVEIGDQQIGYRLPRNTQWQMPGDSEKARKR